MSRKRIDELSKIELDKASSVTRYSRTGRDLFRDFSRELEFAADDFEANMNESARNGNPLLFGLDVKWRARRCANRLRRAADAAQGAAAELTRFRAQFRRDFADAIHPPKKRSKFDFDE